MALSFEKFKSIYDEYQSYGNVTIRHTKEKNNQIIHKEIKLYRKENTFYVKEIEYNETENSKKTIQAKHELTQDTLQDSHAYIATLFSALNPDKPQKISARQDFKKSNSKLKWLVRYFFLDTRLIGGVVGHIIAFSANSGNKHYKTIPSSVLGKTLGPLIFPAGSKKPIVDQKSQPGVIALDSILHKQYKALRHYNPLYKSGEKFINFEPKNVAMDLRGKNIKLETITASNALVTEENKSNHLNIIYFNGNSGCFQHDYKTIAEDLLSYGRKGDPATAVQFNYPGILNSQGRVEIIAQELIDAGIAQVQSLLDSGIPHSKIVLHGVSLGGSISSHVAAHFHKLPKEDNPQQRQTLGGVYASRTFASTAQVGRNYFNRALGNNIFSRTISTLCLPLIKLGTWGSEWDLDTGKAFFSLPSEKRNYSVVLSPKSNRTEYRRQQHRTFFQKLSDFILRSEINPADDAVLGRGLHDSWEKKLDAFLTKLGWNGAQAQNNYSKENSYRKMMVVDFKTKALAPHVDGHAKAHYCYSRDGSFFNPKRNSAMGLVHRTPAKSIVIDEQKRRALPICGNEAGEVARSSMLSMSRS